MRAESIAVRQQTVTSGLIRDQAVCMVECDGKRTRDDGALWR